VSSCVTGGGGAGRLKRRKRTKGRDGKAGAKSHPAGTKAGETDVKNKGHEKREKT
jgi:hypothetical protein